MAEFTGVYRAEHDDWRASPLSHPDLAETAPAVLHTAGFDPLSDEGRAYAAALRADDLPVIHRDWPTLTTATCSSAACRARLTGAVHQ
jgi:acetyl esterase